MKKSFAFIAMLIATSVAPAMSQAAQQKVHLTLYQNNLALIEDHRILDLPLGPSLQMIEGVSAQMIPDSLILYADNLNILSRRFDFNVTTAQKLLEQSLGKTVKFRKANPATGQDEIIQAKILSTQGQGIVEREGNVEVGYPGTLILEQVPDDFLSRPSLTLQLNSKKSGETPLALGYLTSGLQWQAAYVLDVNEAGTELTLKTWANLTNTTNVDFKKAHIALRSGKINQNTAPKLHMMREAAPVMARMSMDGASESVAANAPVGVSNLYVYPIKEKHDLNQGQTLQVALMSPQEFSSKRTLVHRFSPVYGDLRNQPNRALFPSVELAFDNTSGLPLPNGIARVYSRGVNGNPLFLGENTINPTPNGEKVTLKTGQSYDVSLKRQQTAFRLNGLPKHTFRSSYKVDIKNAGKTAETLKIEDRFPGDWKLISASHKPTESLARQTTWVFDLAPGENVELTYQVEVRTR